MVNRKKSITIIIISYIVLLILTFVLCAFGSVKFGLKEILLSLFGNGNDLLNVIIYEIRLPRNLIAVLVGASLSVSGMLLQSVMKNPLADPGITGVSSGASVVAIIILLALPSFSYGLPIASFLGGLIACALVFLLAWKDGGIYPSRIILSGVAINSVFGSVISIFTIFYSDRIQSALLWLNGSLSQKTWADFKVLSVYVIIGLLLALFCIRPANILALGEKTILNLGFNITHLRLFVSIVGVFLAAVCTSIVGIIGFVGLVIPHICRMIVGYDYKYSLPLAISFGGIIVLLADTLSRVIGGSVELPVGIIMSLLGAPFFLYLLRKKKGE